MSKTKNAPGHQPRNLTAEEIDELGRWRFPRISDAVHAEIEFMMERAMEGAENGVVIGPRGAGKTYAMNHICEDIEQVEVDRMLAGTTARMRQVVRYQSGEASGAKTALLELHRHTSGALSAGRSRLATHMELAEDIAQHAKEMNVRLICIDEAQKISPDNLDHLRQVPDRARELEHPLGLVLFGNEGLRQSLVRIGQLGQRFSAEIHMPRVSSSTLAKRLPEAHPHLAVLKEALPAAGWERLVKRLDRSVQGNYRRLDHVLSTANELARRFRRAIDEEIMEDAMARLAEQS
jgi:DNA transposition AAA+ family ATPase